MTHVSASPRANESGSEHRPISYRKLSGTLTADHDALHNDLEQARELTLAYQCQLASKSNEFADLKIVLEKALADLAHMQSAIEELRSQRNHLAHEVAGLKAKLKTIKEGNRLERELSQSKDALSGAGQKPQAQIPECERLLKERDVLVRALACSERVVLDLVNEAQKLREQLKTSDMALGAAESTVREFWRKGAETKPAAEARKAQNETASDAAAAREFIELSFHGSVGAVVSVIPGSIA